MLCAFWDESSKMEEAMWVSVYCPFAITEKAFLSYKMPLLWSWVALSLRYEWGELGAAEVISR